MLASGDFLVPRLNGLLYFEKPPFAYWPVAASLAAFGENAFAARLPSALAALASAALVGWLAARARGAAAGWLAGALLLGCAEFFALGVLSLLDAAFCAWLSAAFAGFFAATRAAAAEPPQRGRAVALAAGAGVACAGGLLTKGLLAPGLLGLAAGAYLLWERRPRDLLRLGAAAGAGCAALAVPLGLLVDARAPGFWHQFVWVEHLARFGDGAAQHPHPWWYLLPFLVGGALPSALLAPAAWAGLRDAARREPLARYALCWLGVPLVVLSASAGKLGSYALPLFPPLALLLALGLERGLAAGEPRGLRAAPRALAVAALALAGACLALHAFAWGGLVSDRPPATVWSAAERPQLALLVGGLLATAGAAFAASGAPSPRRVAIGAALAPLFAYATALPAAPEALRWSRIPGPLLGSERAALERADALVSDSQFAPALAFYTGRSEVDLVGRPGEHEFGLSQPGAAARHLEASALAARVAALAPGESLVVFLPERRYASRLADALPTPERTVVSLGLGLYEFRAPEAGPAAASGQGAQSNNPTTMRMASQIATQLAPPKANANTTPRAAPR